MPDGGVRVWVRVRVGVRVRVRVRARVRAWARSRVRATARVGPRVRARAHHGHVDRGEVRTLAVGPDGGHPVLLDGDARDHRTEHLVRGGVRVGVGDRIKARLRLGFWLTFTLSQYGTTY